MKKEEHVPRDREETYDVCCQQGHQNTIYSGHSETCLPKIMDSQNAHGWIVAILLREMPGLEGQATFENLEC